MPWLYCVLAKLPEEAYDRIHDLSQENEQWPP